MPKKSFQKKKAYRAAMRQQMVKGLINKEDGTWTNYQPGLAMHSMQKNGYKL